MRIVHLGAATFKSRLRRSPLLTARSGLRYSCKPSTAKEGETASPETTTNGRPRGKTLSTGGSCATHVPPIVIMLHPGTGHTESSPYGRNGSTGTSSRIPTPPRVTRPIMREPGRRCKRILPLIRTRGCGSIGLSRRRVRPESCDEAGETSVLMSVWRDDHARVSYDRPGWSRRIGQGVVAGRQLADFNVGLLAAAAACVAFWVLVALTAYWLI